MVFFSFSLNKVDGFHVHVVEAGWNLCFLANNFNQLPNESFILELVMLSN
jgi:hypothetical protein